MEELKKLQSSTFDTIARRRLVEDQDTILELTGYIQELQNEINCMKDSRDFQDAESARSGHSHVTSQLVSFPPHPVPGRNAKPFSGNAEPQRRAAKHLGDKSFSNTKRRLEWKNIKAVTGNWDRSAEDKGSGCGVVINMVDKGVWFTTCQI